MAQLASAQQFPYVWEGTDKKGKRIKGKMLAVSEAAVKADLRRQGVLAKKVRKEMQLFKSGKKVASEDISLFARQLATMLQAGIPMVQCFDIIGNRHDKPSMQKLVLAIKSDIESGTSLHEALGKHPLYFDDLFVNPAGDSLVEPLRRPRRSTVLDQVRHFVVVVQQPTTELIEHQIDQTAMRIVAQDLFVRRPRFVKPGHGQPDACGRRERLRHHAPRDAGSDPRRGRKAGGPLQWLRSSRAARSTSVTMT